MCPVRLAADGFDPTTSSLLSTSPSPSSLPAPRWLELPASEDGSSLDDAGELVRPLLFVSVLMNLGIVVVEPERPVSEEESEEETDSRC